MNLAIIDCGIGNTQSVFKAFSEVGKSFPKPVKIFFTRRSEEIEKADKIVFPGQGAMGSCMAVLVQKGLEETIRNAFYQKPFLGICVGAQLLLSESEEKNSHGFSLYPGKVKHLKKKGAPMTPHMGWNTVKQIKAHPIFKEIKDHERFYFAHSFFLSPEDTSLTLAESCYEEAFPVVIGKDNVIAAQFHPEKSQAAGLQFLRNFLSYEGS